VEAASVTAARNAEIRSRNATIDPRWRDPSEPQSLDQALSRFRPRAPVINQDGTPRPTGPSIGRAYALIEQFVQNPAPGVFPRINRLSVAKGVLERVNAPVKVNQGSGWWCGPAAFIHSLARQDPATYAKFVFDLYDRGVAGAPGTGTIQPSDGFRADPVPIGEDSADWIALGGLRDSSNWWYEYHRTSIWEKQAGGTGPADIEKWFKEFGFREVINKSSGSTRDLDNLKLADSYARRNYRVVLLIASVVITGGPNEAKAGDSSDHFIVLSEPIRFGPPIKMRVFTWGSYETIPQVSMTQEDFLHSYYGFVAARR
jgi:hypothetical protein